MRHTRLTALTVAVTLTALAAACGSDSDDDSEASPSLVETDTTESFPVSTDSDTTEPTGSTVAEDADDVVAAEPIDPNRDIRMLNVSPPPPSWDPATTASGITQIVRFYNAVYDTLLYINADNELEPKLATEWEYDDTNTVLTLTLRDDVTFSDGATFDAAAAKLNLERVQAGTAQTAQLLAGIESIEAPSPTELVITQTEPNVKVLYALGTPASSMVSPDVLENDPESVALNPVGSGPYTLDAVDATTATFVRNDDYWDTSIVFPARQILSSAIDANARINGIITGAVDFIQLSQSPPPPDLIAMVDAGDLELETIQGMPSVISINTSIPPLDNPKVVQAIGYAFDREQLNEITYTGLCEPIGSMFPPGMPGYIEGFGFEYDLDKAKELMEESGVGDVTIQFQAVAGAPTATVELYAAMLAEIGITLEVVQSPAPMVASNFYSGQFAMSVGQLFLSAPDSSFLTEYITGQFNPGNKPAELVDLVNEANALSLDDPDRDAAYEAINEYIFESPVNIPLCQSPNTLVWTPDVVGVEQIPMANIGNMDTSRMGMAAS